LPAAVARRQRILNLYGWLRQVLLPGILVSLTACDSVSVTSEATGQTLCFNYYASCVNPVFDAVIGNKTCSASGCHNINQGSGGAFKIASNVTDPNGEQMLANFFSAKSFANTQDATLSKLLLEPLSGTFSIVGSHTGGNIFPSNGDACYQEILSWIQMPVDDKDDPLQCTASCTPGVPASCG